MSDPHSVVPVSPPELTPGGDASLPSSVDQGSTSGARGVEVGGRPGRPEWVGRAGAATVLLAVGLLLALGIARLIGDAVRSAVLIEVDASTAGSRPSFSDAPEEAARFFAERDTVHVRVPWDMTVADFLGLYHLETNASARAALRDQLGASSDSDLLREGDEVSIALTVTRPGGGSP